MEELRSLEDLLELQAIDLEIDRLLDERQTLPQLEQYRLAHEAAAREAAALTDAQADLRDIMLTLDKTDGELTLAEEKKNSEERRLYAGGLNARETSALMAEVEMLAKRVSEREEATLEQMEKRDAQQRLVDEIGSRLTNLRTEEQRLEASIGEQWKRIDGAIARQESLKAKAVAPIIPELLELYEEMRPHKQGVAVARLAEGVCGGCHLRLTEAEQLEVTSTDPPRCLHCRRILVPR